jgi:adenylyl cyclase-associated protein
LDQVDGAQAYLGKDSLKTEVFTTKCSGVNLNVLGSDGEDEDYKEVALPEQIRSVIGKGGKVVSEIVEHAG